MKVIYTSHLEFRLSIRNIPYNLPRKIFQEANEHYYDNLTKHYIAIHKVKYVVEEYREMIVAYDKKKDLIEIITVHPIRPYQKHSRISSGRWKRI